MDETIHSIIIYYEYDLLMVTLNRMNSGCVMLVEQHCLPNCLATLRLRHCCSQVVIPLVIQVSPFRCLSLRALGARSVELYINNMNTCLKVVDVTDPGFRKSSEAWERPKPPGSSATSTTPERLEKSV